MYAVIKTGGKQFKVVEGETLKVEKLSAEVGKIYNIKSEYEFNHSRFFKSN